MGNLRLAALGVALLALGIGSYAVAGGGKKHVKGDHGLNGYLETPSVSSTGNGTFEARINDAGTAFDYVLTYADLEGNVQQAHIHLGQRSVAGGISAFFCTNLGNGPSGTQPCPPSPATVTGTITAADVIGPTGQGIAAGEFGELVAAIRAGRTYANVHTDKHTGGEIRAQINDANQKDD